jgi:hypothetical protein
MRFRSGYCFQWPPLPPGDWVPMPETVVNPRVRQVAYSQAPTPLLTLAR